MKVAVIQMNAAGDKKRNVTRAGELVFRAALQKVRLIALPEVFDYRGPAKEGGYGFVAETIPGPSLLPLMEIARKKKVFILAGSIYEKIPGSKKVFNTSVLISDRGIISAVYRKIHLFKAAVGGKTVNESKFFLSGQQQRMARAENFNLGLSVCYDVRFPELYLKHAKAGADILCVPSSFTKATGQAHWEILLRARAIENLCYVLAPNQTGVHNGVPSYGNSMIVDPWGKVLARASGDREEIIYAELSKEVLFAARKKLPGIVR